MLKTSDLLCPTQLFTGGFMLVNQQVGLAIAIFAIVLFAIVLWDEIRIEVRHHPSREPLDELESEVHPVPSRKAFR